MNIGIYGGTFNPPHLGHFQAAKAAVAALKLDKLLLVPAAIPPHKDLPAGSPCPEQRMEMVEKMADALAMPGVVEVSALELERQGKSYTADTLAQLKEKYPDAQLWLLMGTDMFLSLHLWRQPEKIMDLAGICAFGRTEQDGEAVFAPQRQYLTERFRAKITTIALPELVDISSTRLRDGLSQGLGRSYLVPAVYGCILMHDLYGVNADLKHLDLPELRACSYYMMKQKRVPHVMGVEEEAVKPDTGGRMRPWPGGRAFFTTAPNTGPWRRTRRFAPSMGWSWTSWRTKRSSCCTPRQAPAWPSTFLENLRRCTRRSSGTPRRRRI